MDTTRSTSAVQAIVSTYRKAPVTLSIFASYFISRIASSLWIDYRLFVSLPGGPLPKNILGWSLHYFVLWPLSLSSAWTSSKLVRRFYPKEASRSGSKQKLSTGAALPQRQGPAPVTAGVIPHRQLTQFCGDSKAAEQQDDSEAKEQAREAIRYVLSTLQQQADSQPSHLRIGPSKIETHSTALFAISHTLVTGSDQVSRSTRSALFPSSLSRRFLSSVRGEFAHLHCQASSDQSAQSAWSDDGSMHLTLHPHDAALLVEQGWGELHSLAGFPSYSGFWLGWPAWLVHLRPDGITSARWWTKSSLPIDSNARVTKAIGLPPTYCLVYSPRTLDEAKVVLDIIHAATTFAIGSRITSH
ncbi:hypothetical protein EX895_004903 [Sporisorium graminicola]|uniref:Luciferase domain-containing protein n=1 Tax=Sporisorium graminicola TaxID=280036 RepID=A0A4U7KS58_9BASI|nr:hypothetical protein EX895_004903 [Sporisorium graminicola]TKY86078.1 hypothetical protein EX895_004903 [Sporisorium graminicola]